MSNKVMVVLEGIDGTGKTTVAKILARRISGKYVKTPSVVLKNVRKYFDGGNVNAKFLFYLAALINSSAEIWDILKNFNVIVDRYLASTICYHQIGGAMVDRVDWRALPIIRPDLSVCLEVSDRNEWLRRISERDGKDVAKKIEKDYTRFAGIAKRINEFVENSGGIVIDTSRISVDQIAEQILVVVRGKG